MCGTIVFMSKTIGIIGYGQFGKLMHKYLKGYFEVRIYKRGGEHDTLEETCDSDIVIFSIPVQFLDTSCALASKYIKKEAIVMDVASVKVQPIEILKKHFPNNEILGTHPIFGPQSERENGGVEGLPIALTNVSLGNNRYNEIKAFLASELKLKIVEKSAKEHDKEMALVQGLSHFIARALKNMEIKNMDMSTHSYRELIRLKDLLANDTWDLFKTIQEHNPYAVDVRNQFMGELQELVEKLDTC